MKKLYGISGCFLLSLVSLHVYALTAQQAKTSATAHFVNNEIRLSDKRIKDNQIQVLTAGRQTLKISKDVLGKIVPNANATLYVYPRYNGIIKLLSKHLGDKVKKGELLASIESDQTLQTYTIMAPFSGYIVKKNANPGEHVNNSDAIYQLADLSEVWLDLSIYRKNAALVKKGQTVLVYNESGTKHWYSSRISYISPFGVEHNQTMLARAVLPNDLNTMLWLPGIYVDAKIIIKEKIVPVAIQNSAIQSIDGKKIVFVKTKNGFEAVLCVLGLQGTHYTEVLAGVKAGQQYAATNSFLLKSELEKDSASHHH